MEAMVILIVAGLTWIFIIAKLCQRKDFRKKPHASSVDPDTLPQLVMPSEWKAYPPEILPVDAIRNNLGTDAFFAEVDARYKVAKSKHQAAIDKITIPDKVDPTLIDPNLLLPQEIVFIWYLHMKPVNKPSIGVYWRLDYGISDYQATIQRLANAALIEVSTDPEIYLYRQTVKQLQYWCERFNLPKSGTKKVLVSSLMQGVPITTLNSWAQSSPTFLATTIGKAYVKINEGLIIYHKFRSQLGGVMDIKAAHKLLRANPGRDPAEVLFSAVGLDPKRFIRR